MHIVRSELVAELLASRHGDAAAGTTLVRINTLSYGSSALRQDADGDLELPRRKRRRRQRQDDGAVIPDDNAEAFSIDLETLCEGSAGTTGTQLWRASFLLAEYLQSEAEHVRATVVLELGCGVGFVAIAAARLARRVYATDGDRSALDVCARNVERNSWARDRVCVQYLVWGDESAGVLTADGHARDANVGDFATSYQDSRTANSNDACIDWIVASDVFYDDEVTDAFLDTLYQLMLQYPMAKVVVAAEKRVVFSAVTLSEIALGYDAFCQRLCQHHTEEASGPQASSRLLTCDTCSRSDSPRFVTTRIPTASIPRIYDYERVSTLQIWQLHAVARLLSE